MPEDLRALPSAAWDELDRRLKAFEAAWIRGERPSIHAALSDAGENRRSLLAELLHLDLEYRLRAGEFVSIDDYPSQFPELADMPETLESLRRLLATRETGAESTSPGVPDSVPVAEAAGELIPNYELLGELGRGGMGIVYRARDTRLRRDVAVKVLSERFLPNSAAGVRFAEEAHITGRLQHPGIPPVHELGTLPDGRPFLAMKLIEGHTLAELFAKDGADRPRLVAAFEQVCQAVGYAHANGVIHRDLKPANVMVGAFGEVQVMDWGLARAGFGNRGSGIGEATGHDRLAATQRGASPDATRPGAVMGTPAFMAPEQARGEVDQLDARTDVFGLGAILCVILTGKPPYRGNDAESVRQLAADGELTDAFARLDACGADAELIGICRGCLSREQAERPANGKAVADEVAAYRAGIEERAKQAELDRAAAVAKAEGERKRRRIRFALGVSVGLLVLGGVGFAWWRAEVDARNARSEMARASAEADAREKQRDVEEQRKRNREAAAELFAQVEVALRDGEAERAGLALAEAEKRIAEGGTDELKQRHSRCRADLAMHRELDGIDNDRWTVVAREFPLSETSVGSWRKAFANYGINPGITSPEETKRRIDGSLIRERLLTSLESWFVDDARNRAVREILTAVDPDDFRDAARASSYSEAMSARGWGSQLTVPPQPVWFVVGHGRDGSLARRTAEQLLLTAHHTKPQSFSLIMALATLYDATDRSVAGKAEGWYQTALAVNPRNGAVWNNLGVCRRTLGQLRAAEAAHRRTCELNPNDPRAHHNLGIDLSLLGDGAGAVEAYKKLIALDPGYYRAYYNLGTAQYAIGDFSGALVSLKTAIERTPKDALAHSNLAAVHLALRNYSAAVTSAREAIKIDPKLADAHFNLGTALNGAGDKRGALAAWQLAATHDTKNAKAHFNCGVVYYQLGELQNAIEAYRAAIKVDPKNAAAHHTLALALQDAGQLDGAIAAFKEALELEPKDPRTHFNLGVAYQAAGDVPKAIAAYRQGAALDRKDVKARVNLGFVLNGSGDLAGAALAFKEATDIDPKNHLAQVNLAGTYLQQKKYREASTAARSATEINPRDPDSHALLGFALQGVGEMLEARGAFAEAARLNPKRWGHLLAKLPTVPVAPLPRTVQP